MHDAVLKLRSRPFTIQLLIHGITFKIRKGLHQIKKNSKLDWGKSTLSLIADFFIYFNTEKASLNTRNSTILRMLDEIIKTSSFWHIFKAIKVREGTKWLFVPVLGNVWLHHCPSHAFKAVATNLDLQKMMKYLGLRSTIDTSSTTRLNPSFCISV